MYCVCVYMYFYLYPYIYMGFSVASDGKESACIAGDPSLIPELGRSPGEESGNQLQYSCLEYSMDRGAWQATVHGIAKSWTCLLYICIYTHTHIYILDFYIYVYTHTYIHTHTFIYVYTF